MNTKAWPLSPHLLILAGILALGLLLRLWAFTGIFGADDVAIADIATGILAEGFSVPTGHYEQRIGLTLPLALIFKFFGSGDWQFALMPMLASLGAILLAYLTGRQLASERVGVLAALLLAMFPLDVVNASLLFPDAIMGTYAALAFYLVLRAEQGKHPVPVSLLAGLLLGIGWLVKVEAILLLPVLGIYWLLDPAKRWHIVLCASIGMFTVLAAESTAYTVLAGDPLRSIHAALNQGGGVFNEAYAAGQLWVFPKAWFVTPYEFGFHYYLLFAAMGWVLVTKQKQYFVLLAWLVVILLWLQFGPNPFATPFRTKSHLSRYCLTLAVPSVVLIAAMLNHLWESDQRKLVSAVVVIVALAGLLLINFSTLSAEGIRATKLGLDYAVEHRAFPLYLDRKSYDMASWYLDKKIEPSRLHPLQQHDFKAQRTKLLPVADIQGWVLINRVFEDYAFKRYNMRRASDALDPSLFILEKSIDNPGNAFAYVETKLMLDVINLLPNGRFTSKAQATAKEILEGGEVKLYRPVR